ncbi:serine hydrolase domain-containing protein [Actinoplanes sp. NPDC051470]|uniref:serine hydrolase domain-containing protein n=1 Tax=Actinoplanes sp. NPDC051470 TaxID=3157224 RepID=UPI00342C3BB7
MSVTRRNLLRAGAAGALITTLPTTRPAVPRAVGELDDKIRAAMERYDIPGVSYALRYRGRDYHRGFGVTNLSDPRPVDADTVFRVASTTKTFTGTAIMRLVEAGKLDLDRTVKSYLPAFRTADPAQSARVTLRQLLNHSPGWLGDYFKDTGPGGDALARFVASMTVTPQLNPPGRTFAYNNAAISVAGRILEVKTGRTYEDVVRDLLLRPLRLRHSAFFLDEIPRAEVAMSHVPDPATGELVASPEAFAMPRSVHAAGGLISSAHDQLAWAKFHLGDGGRLLSRRGLREMQTRPGPGGTLLVELDGMGVTWQIRPTAEGPKVIEHGGDWAGQHSGFLMVPARDMALTVLTNSEGGPGLIAELYGDDWALSRFAGLHNLPARPRVLTPAQLAPYAGPYTITQTDLDGNFLSTVVDLVPDAGRLSMRVEGQVLAILEFYRRDYVRILEPSGADTFFRADFDRGPDGRVTWFRYSGRILKAGATPAAARPFKINKLSWLLS